MATTNALSDYAENELLDHLLGTGAAWTLPAATWLQLHTGAPGESGTANVASFTTRTDIAVWAAAASRAIANTSVLAITGFSTSETITDWSIHDASTAGNCLAYGDFTVNRLVDTGITLNIAAGDIDLDFVGTGLCNYAANAALEHVVGRTTMTSPTNLYVQLHTGAPGDDATANVHSHTRVVTGAMSAAAAGNSDNDAVIAITAGGTPQTLTHWSLLDAASAGNAFFQAALDDSRAVAAAEALEWAAAALDVTIS